MERNPGSGYSGILSVQEGAVVFAYIEYARFSVFKWENGKYLERQRELLKSIGKTKHYCVRNLKKNLFTKWQFFGMIARDLVRVQLDLNNLERNPRHIYPKHILFRGEYEIMDYTLIDQIYISIMLPGQVYLVDQFTEQVLSVFIEFQCPQRVLVLSPKFEIGILPLIIC